MPGGVIWLSAAATLSRGNGVQVLGAYSLDSLDWGLAAWRLDRSAGLAAELIGVASSAVSNFGMMWTRSWRQFASCTKRMEPIAY